MYDKDVAAVVSGRPDLWPTGRHTGREGKGAWARQAGPTSGPLAGTQGGKARGRGKGL